MVKRRTGAAAWLAWGMLAAAGCSGGGGDGAPGGPSNQNHPGPLGDASINTGDAGSPGSGGDASGPRAARIQTRVTVPTVASGNGLAAFVVGAARGTSLSSLKYLIRGIQICESMDASGSGFRNQTGCLTIYQGDSTSYPYGLNDDFAPLGNQARTSDAGFIDLLSATSRAALAGDTVLGAQEVRSYHYGIITWALPIKLTAELTMSDGTTLFTHRGESTSEVTGADGYRNYFTLAGAPLDQGPADEAVVVLPNGGNWFKFQSPLTITQDDIDRGTAFVLDLVLNPDGIVKGFAGGNDMANLVERGDAGAGASSTIRGISVPMLDLSPVPHRAGEQVVRESYQGPLTVDGQAFDVRIELYSVAGDPNATVYGVDVKALVNDQSTTMPPSISKISYLDTASDGSLSFSAWTHAPIITGLRRVSGAGGVTHVQIVCGVYGDNAAGQGGAAIIVNHCPSPTLDVALTLRTRSNVEGGTPITAAPDAGPPDAGPPDAGPSDAAAAPDSAP